MELLQMQDFILQIHNKQEIQKIGFLLRIIFPFSFLPMKKEQESFQIHGVTVLRIIFHVVTIVKIVCGEIRWMVIELDRA